MMPLLPLPKVPVFRCPRSALLKEMLSALPSLPTPPAYIAFPLLLDVRPPPLGRSLGDCSFQGGEAVSQGGPPTGPRGDRRLLRPPICLLVSTYALVCGDPSNCDGTFPSHQLPDEPDDLYRQCLAWSEAVGGYPSHCGLESVKGAKLRPLPPRGIRKKRWPSPLAPRRRPRGQAHTETDALPPGSCF